ncbi:MAG: signal peptide peptidase SppA [Lewinellaceae bacterium]|jgi:protease-4|nr:signal peptide peptidase SppA [Lewinellaceae bacterium]
MSQFVKFLFASCLGTALALALLVFIGFSMLAGMAGKATEGEKVVVKSNSVLELDFKYLIPEKTNNVPLDPFDFNQKNVLGLTDLVAAIRKAKEDPDIKGIYINATYVMAGKATASVLRDALADFRSSGKFIVSYANYYTQGAYYMASVSDSILLNPVGAVDFRGYSSMIAFFKGMLDKLDVQMKIFYAGKFKSATEPYRLDKMSDENRLQIREYIAALYDIFISDVSKGRNIPEAELRQIADRFDGRSAESALKAHLVDRIAYEDEAFQLIKNKIGLGEKEKLNRIHIEDYFESRARKLDFTTKDKIAVLYAEGTILDGEKGEVGNIYDVQYVKMLRKIRLDDGVKAVVLRINSPGGSVLASENILREIQLCKQAGKPVVVSMGDLAASGGYYIACTADSIFAEPGTITGSIGVFGMVPILQKTMKDNLGITYDTVRTGKYSAFGTPFYDFSPEESAIIQTRVEAIYEDFLNKVAAGRHKTRDQVHEIAQGRVWPGLKAKEIGLVDDIGGLDRAISAAAKLAGVEKYRTTEFPRTKTGIEQLIDQITRNKDKDDNIKSWLIRSELGDLYPMYKTMRDIRRSEGIQARLPYELIIR